MINFHAKFQPFLVQWSVLGSKLCIVQSGTNCLCTCWGLLHEPTRGLRNPSHPPRTSFLNLRWDYPPVLFRSEHPLLLDTQPEFLQTLPPHGPPFSFPAEFKKSFERTAQGFWRALKHTASHLSISCIPDRREQTTTSPLAWRGLPRSPPSAHPQSSLSACCLSLTLLSLARDSSTVASLEWRNSGRPEITQLAVGSKEPGNLTSVALQSSPFQRQLAEWGWALT